MVTITTGRTRYENVLPLDGMPFTSSDGQHRWRAWWGVDSRGRRVHFAHYEAWPEKLSVQVTGGREEWLTDFAIHECCGPAHLG